MFSRTHFWRMTGVLAVAGAAWLVLRGASTEELLWRYRNLGKAYYEGPTSSAEAVDEFHKALELNPDSVRDRLNYGLALLRVGKLDEGVAELVRVQRLDPKIPHTWFNLGVVFKKQGQYPRAIEQFEGMLKLVPDEPVSHYNLGTLYRLAGRGNDALKEFETAARLREDFAAPRYQIFDVHREAERQKEAEAALQRFLEVKKRQKDSDADAEDTNWSFYSEIYETIEPAKPAAGSGEKLQPKFESTLLPGRVGADSAGLAALDVDGDGAPDLLVWSSSGIQLFRGGSTLQDVGLGGLKDVIHVAPGDFDNDGLQDLCVVSPGAAALYRNQKGKFVKQTDLAQGSFRSAVWLDYDHDYDLDLFLLGDHSQLMRNSGTNGFQDRTADFPFVTGKAIKGETLRLIPDSKSFDLAVTYADRGGVLYRDKLGGKYEAAPLDPVPSGADSSVDFDNDGWADPGIPEARTWLAADFNQDGRVDLATISRDGRVQLMLNRTASKDRWIAVRLQGVKNLKLADLAEVEVKAGTLYQKKIYRGTPLLFGVGPRAEVDTIRVTWPNGMIQNEVRQATNQVLNIKEAPKLSGSCPMIFTWNGRQFEFITDVLGVAPLGASSGDGRFFPVDHDEYVQIPGDALKARDGRCAIRITEELSEITYLDQVRLIAVDHPQSVEFFTNDKWKSPPFPEFRLFGVGRRSYPKRAADQEGHDVTKAVLARDHKYVDTFRRGFTGVAELHSLTLDFGPGLRNPVLVLNGWVDWADGSAFRAASQSGGLVPPYLQVKDRNGRWRTVIEDMGMPSGKTKTIAVDLTGKFLSASREVRIVTNLCVYWDEIFLGEDASEPKVRTTAADATSADLGFRGFSYAQIHPERKQPELFEYGRVSPASSWNQTPGFYTRYGDVGELITHLDDRLVIMGSGDELQLSFNARSFPAVPPGWKRDFLLLVDGWAKDRDANTAFSQTVEPLPFHAMSSYPYGTGEKYPEDEAHRRYRREYNTRPARQLIPSLALTQAARR